ncbi:thiamine biosynthesis lipoprotein [Larkinella arboricola]|uniref:FAD:protein FMN transferase n=1 Tax=Larkinella arboricola TaxID=643671 RepID=A0A327WWQ3_LARAB|nr:FAD:protein FMN transferase [Larkinella arboricola]RAJ97747.1 thiamine biosynthesis lipoprotein [Larkinella arboricola]
MVNPAIHQRQTVFGPGRITACLLFCFTLLGWQTQAQSLKRYTFDRGLFGTEYRKVFYAPDDSTAQRVRRAVDARMDSLNGVMSDYLDGSEINRLSATAGSGQWVSVSPYLYDVLLKAVLMARKSDGLYDPTIGPLSQLWRRAVRRKIFPSKAELRKAHRLVNYRYIRFDSVGRKISLKKAGMRLDVGGIGQGFANDEGMKVLQQMGIQSALLDIGGDIRVSEPPPGESGWRVLTGFGADTTTLLLKNIGITASGATYRYLEHQGKRYSHLMNPRTGLGLLHHVQTTVLAPDGTQADALTKVFSVAGIRKSRRLIKRFPGVTVWVAENRSGKLTRWTSKEKDR